MAISYLSCYRCEHHFRNNTPDPLPINGKFVKGLYAYCGFHGGGKKMRRIGKRDIPRGRHHPVWCPRYDGAISCCVCGRPTYGNTQYITCQSCRRKGL